jgi:hypothetical protein
MPARRFFGVLIDMEANLFVKAAFHRVASSE